MVLSEWVRLSFPAAPGVKIQGACRLMVTEMDEHFSLYVTPINIDPEKPAMPISHPSYYAPYLAKSIGCFCTLGLAEDTWALNEGITDDATFLQQTYDIDREREQMFFLALDRLKQGSLVCVFDGTDRVQHMFWRYLEEDHPALQATRLSEHRDAIDRYYEHNDRLVAKVLEKLNEDDLLMVISDHGFTSFQRGVNLNRWLLDNGYLALKEGADGSAEWLRDVDWSRTKAYVLGLTGMFLNITGREAHGIVQPGDEARALKAELISKLRGFEDPEKGKVAIRELFDTAKIYDGPYLENAPDLVIGFNDEYRQSWDCATGVVSSPVFEDNIKAWSGDHCVDPRLVPGVFFCNQPIDRTDPDLIDIAPTVLQLFGLPPAPFMEGSPLFSKNPFGDGSPRGGNGDSPAERPTPSARQEA
jgi:predicted AlkP superfamily phosphohydrolase/phosphomutase